MSLDLTNSIEDLMLALAEAEEILTASENPFILDQVTEPRQTDWETAWLAASNDLPIPEDQELYWYSEGVLRGQFGRTNDRFYCLFPSNSVSLGGVSHFAYTRFLGWEDDQHFLFSGTQLNADGQYIGLLRAYLDGTCEQVDFTGFTANTLLGYDEAQGKLWYIEGTDLKRIDTTTEVITTIASGITVAPSTIAFDGAGDAFCTINIGAGLDLYRWNNGATTFTSFKASITVNGAGEDPGQVITASLNYVVVLTSVSNYWVQIARAGLAEVQIKSNPAGATGDNLPQPDATAWVQTYAERTLDVLQIVYTELTGTPAIGEWRKTIFWNMATNAYTETAVLPYDDFVAMCIAEAPSADPINYDARRDVVYHTLTDAYRKRVSSAWEYHNIQGIRANISGSRQILETDTGQIFVWANGSSGKIWRLSVWDQGEADSIIFAIIDITSHVGGIQIDLSTVPPGYDLIEIYVSTGVTNAGAVGIQNSTLDFETALGSLVFNDHQHGYYSVLSDINTYGLPSNLQPLAWHAENSVQGSILIASLLRNLLPGDLHSGILVLSSTNTGVVNRTVETVSHAGILTGFLEGNLRYVVPAGFSAYGKHLIIRIRRTQPQRQGGSYYDPAMA